eukprot:4462775-Prymnesium_polylepis.2
MPLARASYEHSSWAPTPEVHTRPWPLAWCGRGCFGRGSGASRPSGAALWRRDTPKPRTHVHFTPNPNSKHEL